MRLGHRVLVETDWAQLEAKVSAKTDNLTWVTKWFGINKFKYVVKRFATLIHAGNRSHDSIFLIISDAVSISELGKSF